MHFSSLPLELNLSIFQFCGVKVISTTSLVCKEWNTLSLHEYLWKSFVPQRVDSSLVNHKKVKNLSCTHLGWKKIYCLIHHWNLRKNPDFAAMSKKEMKSFFLKRLNLAHSLGLYIKTKESREEVRKLFEDTNFESYMNDRVFQELIKEDNYPYFSLFRAAGFNINNVSCFNSPLESALSFRNLKIASSLLEAGADANSQDMNGSTLLYRVFISKMKEEEKIDCMRLLLQFGANPNLQNKFLNMPIHYAVKENLEIPLSLLLNHKADPDLRDSTGKTPLQRALEGQNQKLSLLLLQNGARKESIDQSGKSILYYTLSLGSEELIEIVLQGTSIEKELNQKVPLLFGAARGGLKNYVNLIIQKGADPLMTSQGNTLLHVAAENNKDKMIKFLVKNHSLKINALNFLRQTPLYQACLSQSLKALKALISLGANLDLPCKKNITPLELLYSMKEKGENVREMIDVLEDADHKQSFYSKTL